MSGFFAPARSVCQADRWRRPSGDGRGLIGLAAALALLAALPIAGCSRGSSAGGARRGPTMAQSAANDELIESLGDNLNHLEEFEADQILPQIRHRLDQWVAQQHPTVEWRPDALVDTLPAPLRKLRVLEDLAAEKYADADMRNLREAVWLRDIAHSARGKELDDVSVAGQLFDWTIRNLQLEEEPNPQTAGPRRFVTEILELGRATARERAWVFILLLRQQGLDGVMLAVPGDDAGRLREWVPALVTDDGLYLFDPLLGLPIPGRAERPVATLSEVAADDALLRKLDLSSQRKYPFAADELQAVVACVEASPAYLQRRMKLVETKLTGQSKVVLSAQPEQIAKRLAGNTLVKEVRYWTLPYEVFESRSQPPSAQQPPAWAQELIVFQAVPSLLRARELQFKGDFDGEKGAKAYYLRSRRSDQNLARPDLHPLERKLWTEAKQDASYWLGLVAMEQKSYSIAADFFARRTLELTPSGPWTDGAHYNLARTYEALGQLDKAIDLLQSDSSPQKHGNRLRARRLKAQLAEAGKQGAAAGQPAADEKVDN